MHLVMGKKRIFFSIQEQLNLFFKKVVKGSLKNGQMNISSHNLLLPKTDYCLKTASNAKHSSSRCWKIKERSILHCERADSREPLMIFWNTTATVLIKSD